MLEKRERLVVSDVKRRRGNFIFPLERILFGKDRVSVERRDEIEQPIFLVLFVVRFSFSNGEFSHGKIQTGFSDALFTKTE